VGIEDKATYGEHYWSMQVEAAELLAEESEKEVIGMAASLIGSLGITEILPEEFKSLFSEIEAPAGKFLTDVGGRFVSEVADGAVSKRCMPFFEALGYKAYMKNPTKKLTPEATAELLQRKKIKQEFFDERLLMAGFEPIEAKFQYDAMRPYPTIPDLIRFSRYHGPLDNVWGTMQDYFDVDANDFKVWEWLGLQQLTTMQVQTLFRRGLISEGDLQYNLQAIGWDTIDSEFVQELSWTTPNAMLLIQGNLHQQQSPEKVLEDISRADINPKYAQQYLDAILTKPASQDIIAYALRKDPTLSGLDMQLRRIGIHPDHFDVYKTLAYPIPPVADIITMAVREAFTPSIAAKFGQYEDYPQEFEDWAMKKGLSADWSKRYWAAHWSLPSAGQGFEMLHRGAINESELHLLLRALDIMPFWRDKLTKIAYRRLSRVDVRRMYQVGVLDEAGVLEAYIELGYNERDAERMTAFTIKQVLATQSKFTARDVVSAYAKYMINRSEASSLLHEVGVRDENISFILSSAEYKRDWELTEDRIAAIRNLYKKQVYTPDIARSELLKLDLPAEQVDVLMSQWYIDEKDKPPRNWTTAQTLSFIKEGLITADRGRQELVNIGYNREHIDVYMKASE